MLLPVTRLVRPIPAFSSSTFLCRNTTSILSCRYASKATKAGNTTYRPLPGNVQPATIKKATQHPSEPPSSKKAGENVVEKPASEKSDVNPPASTRPPLLDVPERQPDQGAIKYYLSIGKAYFRFYKAAFKAVWSNYKLSRALVASLPPDMKLYEAATSGRLTRAEFQTITRARRDIRKLPAMTILLGVFGEYLPFIVIFVPGLVPRVAWIPKQIERVRSKVEARRGNGFRAGTLDGAQSLAELASDNLATHLSKSQILHISRALNMHSTMWETFWDRPPQWIVRRRLRRVEEYLLADDTGIASEGGVKQMSDEEVILACEERGIDLSKTDIKTLRTLLQEWIDWRTKSNITLAGLTLIRPGQWSQLATSKQFNDGGAQAEKTEKA